MLEKNHKLQGENAERVILVGFLLKSQIRSDTLYHLQELSLLARTAGARVVESLVQQRSRPSPATFLGSGKLLELKSRVESQRIDTVIFDDELSPTQQKNLEESLGVKVIDRTQLILDIFARRAKTAHAKAQVELAQYQYFLPRLTRLWTHLERQRGGIGTRGPGEKEIETDRRMIRDKITRLKKQLVRINRQKATQRNHRGKLVRLALIGYTNAGKSTLLNLFAKTAVLVEDKLFATLDTKVKRIIIRNLPLLLTDTVGFIHKLPHCLIESFKATLDEVREADILLHVIDASHPRFRDQIQVVQSTLRQLASQHKPTIQIYNKIDLLPGGIAPVSLRPGSASRSIAISARKRLHIEDLKGIIYREGKTIHQQRYPYNDLLFPDEFLPGS